MQIFNSILFASVLAAGASALSVISDGPTAEIVAREALPVAEPGTHEYPENYKFARSDGWSSRRSPSPQAHEHFNAEKRENEVAARSISAINKLFTPSGSATTVIITWYTGVDLKNPSCWPNSAWAPSDSSFAGAITSKGWVGRPDCLSFVEREWGFTSDFPSPQKEEADLIQSYFVSTLNCLLV